MGGAAGFGAGPPPGPGLRTDRGRPAKLLLAGAAAGAVSRTLTAPIDRLRMLFQVHEAPGRMTLAQGMRKMAAEGTVASYFRGNGANCLLRPLVAQLRDHSPPGWTNFSPRSARPSPP